MKLQAVVDSLDGIPEDFHENYEETNDGTFRLVHLSGFVPKESVEDVSGLKSALQKERQNAKAFAQQLKEFQDKYGDIDIDEIKVLKAEQARLEEEKAKAEGRWDDLKRQLNEAHQKEITKERTRIQALETTVERNLIDGEAARAIAAAEGNTDLLLPHVKSRVKVLQSEDGQFAVRVVDEHGNPRVNGQGDFMGIRDLVSEMREQETFAGAFKSKVAGSGSGTAGNEGEGTGRASSGGGAVPKNVKRSSLDTALKKVQYIRAHGKEAFDALPYE